MIRPIERAGGTRFQVYGQCAGRKVYVGTRSSQREAEALERRHRVTQEQIAAGELAPDVDLRRTLAEAVREWLASLKDQGSRSLKIYEHRMDEHILPTLGGAALARIGSPQLIRWRDNLSHKVSAATVNTTIGTLSSAFEWFRSMQWASTNPCTELKRLEETPPQFEWLRNSEQITRLLAACVDSIRPIVALMIGTGMRIDETLHLEWDDIDLEHRLIHVHRGRQGTKKSGKARSVPIFDCVQPLLRELKLKRGTSRLVFPNPHGKVRSKPGVSVPFKRALVKAGLPTKIRPHDLRHSFAILYLLDGGDLHRISRILGHSTVITTERAYLRFKPTGFDLDYGRVAFRMPTSDNVVQLRADAAGRRRGDMAISYP